jgi:hypothetical protein
MQKNTNMQILRARTCLVCSGGTRMILKTFLTTLQILHMARGCGVAMSRKLIPPPAPAACSPSSKDLCGDRHGTDSQTDRQALTISLPASDVAVTFFYHWFLCLDLQVVQFSAVGEWHREGSACYATPSEVYINQGIFVCLCTYEREHTCKIKTEAGKKARSHLTERCGGGAPSGLHASG